ncbi:activating signal cointegrator 1 complex subunit 1 isoform X2 [Passer domesticus]|uniref:activating signal cointegrator 1 complex subunit 1 isoform X2 n=1 Tax=Passer domesticus TaxID=48849 RepID=UPI0030FE8444
MDVLRPPLVRIGGRVYRKNLIQEQAFPQQEEEESFYAGPGECADEPCDAFGVEETERGFQCRLEVPSPLYKYIIGKKGETKKRLETETRTSISIPKPGVEGEIVITGQQRSGVTSARTRIDVLLDSFRKRQPFTHFLSLPLNQPAIQEKFLQFKEEVLEKCSKDQGVSSSLFQNPAKLHLTIGTLVLLNEQEIQKACDLLQRCKEDFVDQITGGQPLTVEVAGVEYMNDDPAMTDVLYAKVHMKDGSDREMGKQFLSCKANARGEQQPRGFLCWIRLLQPVLEREMASSHSGISSLPLVRIRHCRNVLGTAAAWKFLQLLRHEHIALIPAPAACPRMGLPSDPGSQGQTQRWE